MMKRTSHKLFVAAMFGIVVSTCLAADRLVPTEYATIQGAIDAAGAGDMVIVDPCTYHENINFNGKNITVTSTNPDDPRVVGNTIIWGDGTTSVVTFANGEGPDAVISGFTITGGYGTVNAIYADNYYWGAGIYCYDASPTIRDNIVTGNSAPLIEIDGDNNVTELGLGGGIACINSSVTIERNIIKENAAYYGPGIITIPGDVRIANNFIHNNSGTIGGAVALFGGELINNTLVANQAVIGGNVYAAGDCYIANNIIANSIEGDGIYWQEYQPSYTIAYNDVWNNAGGNYSEIADQTGLNGNISENPLFVDAASDDYQLQDISPCINGGDPCFAPMAGETDIDGQERVFADTVDIGCDEYTGSIAPVANAGDDQYIDRIRLVELDGSKSWFYDPEGITEFQWAQTSGPAVELSDNTAIYPTFMPSSEGEYTFELLVSDDGETWGRPDWVLVVIDNREPVADAGSDQAFSSVPPLISLDGSSSFDPGGDTISYRWAQIEGPAVVLSDPCVVDPCFVPAELGIYVFELVVNDGLEDSEADTVGIVVGNQAPLADAGGSRYAGIEAVALDGTASYDPDGYGELSYEWVQVSGPAVVITDELTATPTISGFTQTSAIQECEFELIVSDGCDDSPADSVSVIIVASFGSNTMYLSNPPFDPDKPTILAFGGGNCNTGGGMTFGGLWEENANWITVNSYGQPYYHYGDMLIVYLSSVAPDYKQLIQTMGFSTGNTPAMDTANHINQTYQDGRYAVNRVSLLDAVCKNLSADTLKFQNNPVDGEPAWVDNYRVGAAFIANALNVDFPGGDHGTPVNWYISSAYESSWLGGDMFAGGITAGYFVSVAGPAKNLDLATDATRYYYKWMDSDPDYLVFKNESSYPGMVPEPVTLVGPDDGAIVDASGVVLTCEISENAVGYQLLFGPDPQHMDYIVSDTQLPPDEIITEFFFEPTYWTVKARDQYGSTIYADPCCFHPEIITAGPIENLTTNKKYVIIQYAIDEAYSGETILVGEGIYYENINFDGKDIVLTSTDPCDGTIVDNTIIDGSGSGSVVTFAGTENSTCKITGLTITGGSADSGGGINGNDTQATIANCVITSNSADYGGGLSDCDGTISKCVISDNTATANGGGLVRCNGAITNCLIYNNTAEHGGGMNNCNGLISNCTLVHNNVTVNGGGIRRCDGVTTNCIVWDNSPDQLFEGSEPTYSCFAGGTGINIDVDPAFVDPAEGDYHLMPGSAGINSGDPCYAAGPDETDLDGNLRVIGSAIDMGAYEFNNIPIADAGQGQITYTCIEGIAEVTLDGSGSTDADGDELEYYWYLGDELIATGIEPVIELSAGEHVIELFVDDGVDESGPDEVIVTVVGPIEADLHMIPQLINRKGRARRVIAWLRLPDGIDRSQVDGEQMLVLQPGGIQVSRQFVIQHYSAIVIGFFDKAELLDAIPNNGRVELTVVGKLKSGQCVYGRDTVRIFQPRRRWPW